MAKQEQTAPPSGTGAAPGLGEAFSINLSSGQGTYTCRLPLSEGVAGHTPKLTLEYAHGTGHGPWGLGWRMTIRSISRRLDFGTPNEGLVERFMDNGAEIVQVNDGTYRAQRETLFSRYHRLENGWRIEDRNGLVHELGIETTGRVADPDHPDRIVEWLLETSTDPSGNRIQYTYRFDHGMAYPDTIRYAIYEVRFVYEDRPDRRREGRAGYLRQRTLRCSRIEMVMDPGPGERVIRSWSFAYSLSTGSAISLLTQMTLVSHGTASDGSLDVRRPPIQFEYSAFDPTQFRAEWMTNDGAPPPGLNELDVALLTLDDAPLPGILINRNGREYYWANRGQGKWAAPQPLRTAPITSSFSRAGVAFVDMDGSGDADMLVANEDELQGYYENQGRKGWGGFVPFPRGRRNTPAWHDPNLRLLDADGDGVVDAMISQPRALVWWRNGGRLGWDSPVLIPKSDPDLGQIDFSDPDVFLADMSGDGLMDIVRVGSGRVEYWPGLGRGRFGARVVMQNAPRLRRVPNDTLLLVDLDGDGCAELIHVSSNGLRLYQNQNGERFGDPLLIANVPPPIADTVRSINLDGRLSAGLLWNSDTRLGPGYVRFGLADAQLPYLLSAVESGAGLRSELFYRSAVEDYLRDRAAGRAWTTHFPFPYLVVARTKETDRVSGRSVEVLLKYHEAHFEGRTRQFQGFRTTERVEKGDESRPDSLQVHHFLMAQEREPGNGPEHAVLNGLLQRLEWFQLDGAPAQGRPTRVETSGYALKLLNDTPDGAEARSFVFVSVYRLEDSERTNDLRVEEKTYVYDDAGNVVREEFTGSGSRDGAAQPIRTRLTEIVYGASTTRYLLGKPSRTTIRDASNQLVAEKRFFYDGADFVGLPFGQVDRGLVSKVEEWVQTQADFDQHYAGLDQNVLGYVSETNADGTASVFARRERTAYDARGLPVATQDPLGNQTDIEYDSDGLHRIRLNDPIGETHFDYDRATGQISRITYPDGAAAQFEYDAQGRLLQGLAPAETEPATIHAYDETVIPNRKTVQYRQLNNQTSTAITYFDGYGKPYQQRIEMEPGRFVVSGLQKLNPWGDLKEEFEPTFDTSADFGLPDTGGRASRRLFYDARGRVISSINYNGARSTVLIEPFRITSRDANDNDSSAANRARGQFNTPHVEEFDVFRQLLRVTEQLSATRSIVTNYETGVMGELVAVLDGRGEKFRYRYDQVGNRLELALRDAGQRKLYYDAGKRLIRSLDGQGHDLRAQWDSVGRLLRLSSGADVLEKYTYDTPAQSAFGRIAAVQYSGGRQVFEYDPQGRIARHQYLYDGFATPVTLRYEYDPLGRETACLRDDGTRLERQFHFNGWLKAIPGVLDQVEVDPRGLPIEIQFSNGVKTACEYTGGPGRLRHQTTTSAQGDVLEDTEFTLDALELMLSSNAKAPNGAGLREFSYDPVYQLTGVASTENGSPVQRSYEYVNDFNLARFQEGRVTLHYDSSQTPDRLTGLTPDSGTRFDVDYDGNGNLLSLPGQRFSYDAKNELMQFSRADGLQADYRYDHHGIRVSKRVQDAQGNISTTRYTGSTAEFRAATNKPDETLYHVRLGDRRVATIRNGQTQFVHEDGLGSTSFLTDVSGQVIGRVDQLPFGTVLASSGVTDTRTFSLHPVDDESGLVYMCRRYYSPALGRFLTPDLIAIYKPEQLIHHPQHLHLYTFVANDPLNKTDPTGLSVWGIIGLALGIAAGIAVGMALITLTGGLAGIFGVVGLLIGMGIILGVSLAVVGISYVIAANLEPGSKGEEFLRGFMIGFNAGMNIGISWTIFCPYAAVAIGAIGALAGVDKGISSNHVYQGILGWSSWLMPMSWTMTAIGLAFYVVNFIAAGVTWNGDWYGSGAKIEGLSLDWRTGTFVMVGGLTSPGRGNRADGYNLGNFVYVNPGTLDDGTYQDVMRHETGHTLNTAVFGTAFEAYTLIDQILFNSGHEQDAYGEKLAESIVNRTMRPTIPLWG
jgi:RHS repeat-associated protein